MTQAVFVAVDIGAESGRVVAGCLQDKRFMLEELHRFSNGPISVENHIYWDVARLWSEIKKGLAAAVQKFGDKIVSIGVDTWGVDFGLLDKHDELVSNPYHYRDDRTEGMVEKALRCISKDELYSRTGVQFMRINTLYQLLAMSIQEPRTLESAQSFLMMPDLFHYWLCGTKTNEFSNATTTQFFDSIEGRWSTETLQQLNISPKILQRVVPAGTLLGSLKREASQEIGANHSIKVVAPATHDTGSAVAAAPLSDQNSVYISSGTWSLVGMELPEPLVNEKSLAFNFTNEGGVGGTFRFLRNVMGLWLVSSCRRAWQKAGKQFTHTELIKMAAAADPFRSHIDPDDQHFLSPDDMPDAIRDFCRRTNQPEPETEGDFIRCGLESLALKYRWVIERLEELTSKAVSAIHIVGGGSQNRLLNQFTADATGKLVIAGPVEATATGNALVQAMGLGYLDSHAELRKVVSNSFELQRFQPQHNQEWESAYQRFVQWL